MMIIFYRCSVVQRTLKNVVHMAFSNKKLKMSATPDYEMSIGHDEVDTIPSKNSPIGRPGTLTSTSKYYNMEHSKRGYIFDLQAKIPKDTEALSSSFEGLGFEVDSITYDDVDALHNKLAEVAKMDHTNNDCLLIAILYHHLAMVDADRIRSYFTADECLTLASKPKLFLLHAWTGNHSYREADGQRVNLEQYRIPIHADIFIAYSSEEFVANTSAKQGSKFIQALSRELKTNGMELDIFKLFTVVLNEVNKANNTQLNDKEYIPPSFHSMLIRKLNFNNKSNIIQKDN